MITDKFVFFYGGVFSQWYMHDMEIDGVIYNCAEQYMMAMKATTFNDEYTHALIMDSTDPREQKAAGRKVRNFDANVWNAVAKDFVFKANYAKFTSDPGLKQELIDTGDREIVEASPTDKIWGIGLGLRDPNLTDKSKWQGTNWLGECIMNVRETLRERSQAW